MPKKPIADFLIALSLLIIAFWGVDFISPHFNEATNNYIFFIGLLLSFLFALRGAIRGVKDIKRKESSFIYNLIAIIGSTLILCLLLFIGSLFVLIRIDGVH